MLRAWLQGRSQWACVLHGAAAKLQTPSCICKRLLLVSMHKTFASTVAVTGGRSNMDVVCVCVLFVGCAACSCMHS
jgi:hypothetical protein